MSTDSGLPAGNSIYNNSNCFIARFNMSYEVNDKVFCITESRINHELWNYCLGWEIREDEKGRRFYIDHNSKKTMWKRPEISDNSDSEDCRLVVIFFVSYMTIIQRCATRFLT